MQRLPKRKAEKAILKWLNRYTLPPQRVIKKSHAFLVVIGDSIVAGLRRNPTVWITLLSRYKIINLGIGGDQPENLLWRVNDIVLPKSFTSVVIHCSMNNIDTSN